MSAFAPGDVHDSLNSRYVTITRLAIAASFVSFLLLGGVAAGYGTMFDTIADRFDISVGQAGVVLSAHFGGAFAGVVAVGRLRAGPAKGTVRVALAACAAGCLGVAFAPTWATFLVAAGAFGLGSGALAVALNALFARTDPVRRPALLNVLNSNFGIGAVIAPLLLAFAGDDGIPIVFACAGVLAVLLAAAIGGIDAPTAGEAHAFSSHDAASRATFAPVQRAFIVAFFFYVGAESAATGWMATHLDQAGRSATLGAVITSAFWLCIAIGRLIAARLVAHVSPSRIVQTCIAIVPFGMLLAAIPPIAPAAWALTGLACGPIFPTGLAWASQLSTSVTRTTVWLLLAAMGGGALVSPLVGGAVSLAGEQAVPYSIATAAASALVAFALAGALSTSHRRRADISP